jgi:predicted permease
VTRTDLAPALKAGSDMFLRARGRFNPRNILIVSQIAGSLTLLVVLGLLSVGIQSTLGIQTGFNPDNLYLISFDPVRDGYSAPRAAAFAEKLLSRVKTMPSITAAALTETVPVSMPGAATTVSSPTAGSRAVVSAIRHTVGRDYFDVTGVAIQRGRAFREQEETEGSGAAIVSAELARQLWNAEDPIGRAIELGNGDIGPPKVLPGSFDRRPTVSGTASRTVQVIGVAGDVAEGLVAGKPRPAIYLPLQPANIARPSLFGLTLIVRAAPGVDPIAAVHREIAAIGPEISPFHSRSMADHTAQFMAPLNVAVWTYTMIGVFGLVLTAVGLAGVTAYTAARRRREIGIRMALGAESGRVLALVMKEGLALALAGTALGMAGAMAGARLLASMNASVGRVTSTSTTDLRVLIGAPLLLAALALIACYLPAVRAARVDPAETLRAE